VLTINNLQKIYPSHVTAQTVTNRHNAVIFTKNEHRNSRSGQVIKWKRHKDDFTLGHGMACRRRRCKRPPPRPSEDEGTEEQAKEILFSRSPLSPRPSVFNLLYRSKEVFLPLRGGNWVSIVEP
jgi:hypothetical protein